MNGLKIGIALASLRQPLTKAIIAAARLGAHGVEIDARNDIRPDELSQTGLRQLRKLLDDHQLRVAAVSYPTRRGYEVAEQIDARLAGTKEAMKLAYSLGASVVVNSVGTIAEKPEGAEWTQLVAVLSDLGRFGHHVGARLAARTGGQSGADLARLIEALPAGAIGVDLDPGALLVNGFSPAEAVESLGPHILHVHATDGVRDVSRGRGTETPLGRGLADFPALLAQLEQHNYRGYFTIARPGASDPIVEIGAAVQYFEKFVEMMGSNLRKETVMRRSRFALAAYVRRGIALGAMLPLVWLAGSLWTDGPAAPAAAADKKSGDTKTPDKATLEKHFAELLTGATLVGHYTEGAIKADKPLAEDRYLISKLSKVKDDTWLFEARIQVEGFDLTLPIPLRVVWAGDTPVITLDEATLPGLGTFSVRLLFHGDQYAGVWRHGAAEGQMFGRIERPKKPAEK